jgi:hypothetical protein
VVDDKAFAATLRSCCCWPWRTVPQMDPAQYASAPSARPGYLAMLVMRLATAGLN